MRISVASTAAMAAAIAVAAGCGGGKGEVHTVEVPSVALPNGHEKTNLCFSHTLNNEETIYVHKVDMEATRGIHHSNWFYVDEDMYQGGDGLWDCDERSFDTVGAATSGGVLFAQSTQAIDETQEFRRGAAIPVPPNSRIVGNLHMLNTFGEDVDVNITLDVHGIPEPRVDTPLAGLAIEYLDLEIPPRSVSHFTVECDGMNFQHKQQTGRPMDFNIHYVLPHYHELGNLLRLEVVGGPNAGDAIWETQSSIGEPLGGRIDPPYDMTGAKGLKLTCGYENPRNEMVGWGVGDQEMCIAFAFTDSELMWGGGVLTQDANQVVGENQSGTVMNEAPCSVVAVPADRGGLPTP